MGAGKFEYSPAIHREGTPMGKHGRVKTGDSHAALLFSDSFARLRPETMVLVPGDRGPSRVV